MEDEEEEDEPLLPQLDSGGISTITTTAAPSDEVKLNSLTEEERDEMDADGARMRGDDGMQEGVAINGGEDGEGADGDGIGGSDDDDDDEENDEVELGIVVHCTRKSRDELRAGGGRTGRSSYGGGRTSFGGGKGYNSFLLASINYPPRV